MAVKEEKQTENERQQEENEVKKKSDDLTSDLASSLDLDIEDDEELEGEQVDPIKQEEEVEEEEEEEEEDEDVIPKSKFEKRIRSEVEKRKILEARLRELEEKSNTVPDSRRDKLEGMSESELKSLKRNAMMEYKRAEDADKEGQLLDLADEIDEILRTGPQRFQKRQVEAFNKTAQRIALDNDDIDLSDSKTSEKIKEIAQGIYNSKPQLQKMVEGQSLALELAVDHYKSTNQLDEVKSKEGVLKRKVNKLKRQTSLDSGTVKGSQQKVDMKKLRAKARESKSVYDKEAVLSKFINVDKYLPASQRG